MSKRKYRHREEDNNVPQPSWYYSNRADSVLYLEAHEADVVHHQEDAALSLEAPDNLALPADKGNRGGALQKLSLESGGRDIFVDRYDARLLLTSSLSSVPSGNDDVLSPEPLSPSGWSDIPSDAEDTFFFTPEEAEDFRREKRRRLLDRDREDRLRNLRAEEGDQDSDIGSIWGGSDESPDDDQIDLMRRTANHILAAENPAQLEMRILANHGADKRFAFLRGRWKKAWMTMKARARHSQKIPEAPESPSKALPALGLGDYGDSEEEDDGPSVPNTDAAEITQDEADNSLKEARRARAREWIAKRRSEKDASNDS